MHQQASGITGLAFGSTWVSAAARALGVFVLGYVLPAFLSDGRGLPGFLQLMATIVCFAGAAIALYRALEAYSLVADAAAEEEAAAIEAEAAQAPQVPAQPAPATPAPPMAVAPVAVAPVAVAPVAAAARPAPAPEADGDATVILSPAAARAAVAAAAPVRPELPEPLGQAALERLCIALYRFNGLRSDMAASGVPGEYRIRLFPRNSELPSALLLCRAGAVVQGVEAVEALLRDMQDAQVEKGFFVAPAGFAPGTAELAKDRHVTLVDQRLLRAMLDRLPDGARGEAVAAAHGILP